MDGGRVAGVVAGVVPGGVPDDCVMEPELTNKYAVALLLARSGQVCGNR